MGGDLWKREEPDYAQVVFDAVKDNPSYSKLLQDANRTAEGLAWFWEYLHSIRNHPTYSEVLAKMVDFMCEELQHERFRDIRPAVLESATRVR
jgi:senataxin